MQRKLFDGNERLVSRIDDLQKKYDKLVVSKTDLAAQLLKSDEDKLKVCYLFLTMAERCAFVITVWNNDYQYAYQDLYAFPDTVVDFPPPP